MSRKKTYFSSSTSVETDDESGYCRPPVRTRFAKGVSGNPNGRPRGSGAGRKSLKQILVEKMPVRKGDHVVELPIYEVLITNLVNLAMNGNAQVALKLLRLVPYEEIQRKMPRRWPTQKELSAMSYDELWAAYKKELNNA